MAHAPSLPQPEVAFQKMAGLYNEVFFHKLAEYGLGPQNEAEAQTLLESAVSLRAQHQKQASTSNRFAALSHVLPGVGGGESYESLQEQADQSLALKLASDPEIYASLLSLAVNDAR